MEAAEVTDAALAYEPSPSADAEHAPPPEVIAAAERVLEDWFGRPVALLSSGRTGLRLLLRQANLSRHEDRIWLPRYVSRCIINAVTFDAMPSEEPADARATLLYHQYGFAQRRANGVGIIEDVAHAFFARPDTGARRWHSDAAIFSLPKFFGVAGLIGGVVGTPSIVEEVRERAGVAEDLDARRWMRETYRAAHLHRPEGRWLEAAYEMLFELPTADPWSLTGFPSSVDELAQIGATRAARAEEFRRRFRSSHPEGLWDDDPLPYALPFFGASTLEAQQRVRAAVTEAGFRCDRYRVDVARDMAAARYEPCLLVPGHQEVDEARFDVLCTLLERHASAVPASRLSPT